MIKLVYPTENPALKKEGGKELIFCMIRKRWFMITPEEWVRQHFLLYLVHVLKYPPKLIAVEKQLQISERKKRFDIVVYKNDTPFMIVECKEMNVPLSEKTILQVLHYNSIIMAPLMVVTNGGYCAAFKKEGEQYVGLEEIPEA